MPIEPLKLPFMQHVAELRKRLTISVMTILVLSFVFYEERIYKTTLDLFLAPVKAYLPGGKLTVLGPFEQLTFRFKVALFAAIFVGSPVVLWQLFAFLMPALKDKERKWFIGTVFSAILLFLGGASFAYFVIMGPAFQWLSAQGAGAISSLASANLYLSGIGMMLVGFGIGFELPLVVFYLIGFNILPYQKVRESWRYAYVGIVVVASIATPDWSPWTMGGLSLALVFLYEASLLLSRVVFGKKIAEQKREAAEYAAYYEDDEPEEDDIDTAGMSKKEALIARAQAARDRSNRAEAARKAKEAARD